MKKNSRLILALASLFLLATLLAGCAQGVSPASTALEEEGTLVLRVNPEISVSYNKEGLVTRVSGRNDDGEKILSSYADFVGKETRQVVKELVEQIHAAGYFVEEIEGEGRTITIEIEPGSVLPKDDFLQVIARDVQGLVKDLRLNAPVRADGLSDFDDSGYTDNQDDDSDYAGKDDSDYDSPYDDPDSDYGDDSDYVAPKPAPSQPKPAPAPAPKDSDYDDSDYDDDSDYVAPAPAPTKPAPAPAPVDSDYDDSDYDDSDYDDSDYDSDYDD